MRSWLAPIQNHPDMPEIKTYSTWKPWSNPLELTDEQMVNNYFKTHKQYHG